MKITIIISKIYHFDFMRLKTLVVAIILASYLAAAAYSSAALLKEFTFDDEGGLKGWDRMVLNGQVEYQLIRIGSNGYIQALSEKTCSALYYKIGFKLNDYPVLSWKWKALRFPDISKANNEKERDDYAARVYVIFPFLNFSSSKFLEYVWAEDLPVGAVMDSPSGGNVKKIVIRSGRSKDDEWVYESRNVYEDYEKAFGKKPNMRAGAIAIMCDADGTKTVAESSFDEIMIANQPGT